MRLGLGSWEDSSRGSDFLYAVAFGLRLVRCWDIDCQTLLAASETSIGTRYFRNVPGSCLPEQITSSLHLWCQVDKRIFQHKIKKSESLVLLLNAHWPDEVGN